MNTTWTAAVACGLTLALVGAGEAAGRAPRTELNFLSGTEAGTYYALARDLERLAEEVVPDAGVDIDVVSSQGALQNAIEVFRHRTFHLAITQLDVASYLKVYAKENDEARRVVDGLQLVLPLFAEEVHLLARAPAKGLGALSGKRVAIGEAGSGVSVTAVVLLHLAGVQPAELLTLDGDGGLAALRRGQIDAMVVVAGAPMPFLAERVVASDGFVLAPVQLQPLPDQAPLATVYHPVVIPAGTYPWQAEPVTTVAVRSGVVTSGNAGCDAIGAMARMTIDNLAWLRQNGHPKWKSVVLDEKTLRGHPRLSPCVAKRLR
jgi:TRAP transporter TAXI family solute receptor